MSETYCEIVFRGKILAGFDRTQVQTKLVQLLDLSPAAVDALLSAPKTILRSGLDKEAAARFREALLDAGIMVAVITQPGAPTVSAPPAVTTSTSTESAPADGLALCEFSLSDLGTSIAERRAFEAPKVNLKGLRLSRSNAPLESRPVAAAVEVKVPDLPLAEPKPERDKVLSKLNIELTKDARRT